MPQIGSDAWIDAFNRAVAEIDPGEVEVTVLHRVEAGPAWLLTVADGTIGVDTATGDDDADLVFTWQRDDAEAVARGDIGPLVAFQAGRLRIGGDLTTLGEVVELFTRFPAVPAGA